MARGHSRRPRAGFTALASSGLQWLFEGSDEDEEVGPGVIAGTPPRLPPAPESAHVGWNSLEICAPSRLLMGVESGTQGRLHAFRRNADITPAAVAATTDVAPFALVVEQRARLARSSPEKSGTAGVRTLGTSWRYALERSDRPPRRPATAASSRACSRRVAQCRRSCGTGLPLQRGGDRRAGHLTSWNAGSRARHCRDDRAVSRELVDPAGGRRRNQVAEPRRGGNRSGGGQGQSEQCGARRSRVIDPAWRLAMAARPSSSPSTPAGGRALRRRLAKRQHGDPGQAVEWAWRPSRGRRRYLLPRSTATARARASTASSTQRCPPGSSGDALRRRGHLSTLPGRIHRGQGRRRRPRVFSTRIQSTRSEL